MNLVAGVRSEVKDYFEEHLKNLGLEDESGLGVNIIYSSNRDNVFPTFQPGFTDYRYPLDKTLGTILLYRFGPSHNYWDATWGSRTL